MRLEGKVALVTGAASGIGAATARAFAREGARVVLVDRDVERGPAAVRAIVDAGGQALFVPADLTEQRAVEGAIAACVSSYERLDILSNNAGISGRSVGDGPVADCSPRSWDQVMEANLRSTYLCCHFGVRAMLAGGRGGAIINLSSVLGLVGARQHFISHAYAASKGAIIALSRAMAVYYAHAHIRVNVLCPGLIETGMTARAQGDPAILESIQSWQPLSGGLGVPDDVAAAAVYLAADEAAFVTGAVLAVDGGWTAQ